MPAAAWEHLNLLGEYDFSEDKLQDSVGIKAPKTDRLNQVPSWEFRNRRKSFTARQLARILWDFTYLCWANPTQWLVQGLWSDQAVASSGVNPNAARAS